MSDHDNTVTTGGSSEAGGGEAKRPWHTPSLEEVDYSAAEAGVTGVGIDAGIYS